MIFLPAAVYVTVILSQPFEMPRYLETEPVDCRAAMRGAFTPCPSLIAPTPYVPNVLLQND
jgi:hypothetical protein